MLWTLVAIAILIVLAPFVLEVLVAFWLLICRAALWLLALGAVAITVIVLEMGAL